MNVLRLRPWKGSTSEFEVDVIIRSPAGRTFRKRVKAPVSGKSNSERWGRALEQEMLVQILNPTPETGSPAPRFDEFAAEFLALCKVDGLSISTLKNYDVSLRLHLLPVLGRRRLDEIEPSHITSIKEGLSAKSHNTKREVLKTLRRVLNRAVEEKKLLKIPLQLAVPEKRYKAPVAYSEHQQAALLAAAHRCGEMYVAMVLLGLDGGLRRGEILGLQWLDLDLERTLMTVRHNVVHGRLSPPKGRTEDDVGLTRRLAAALEALPRSGPFVLDNAGSHFHARHVETWLRMLHQAAELPWRGTHILRRTCGTRIADGGGGVAAIATHLRHKDLQTASRYVDRRGAISLALKALQG